ncbi:MAG: hypothetical protein P4L98_24285 [Ancalomicrobiaceae bacterium]|nr:hypothetical protein [Ancalomicrobiaceae bacterium]
MKTLNILLVAASLSVLSTAAFAQPSDSVDIGVAGQIALGNVKASNDSTAAAVVEGRQAAANVSFSATDRVYVDLQNVRDRNKPTNNNY